MRNKRLISEDDIKVILSFILQSGMENPKFKTELGHFRTKMKTKKADAEFLRAKDKLVANVDNLLKNKASAQAQKNYENSFNALFTLAQELDAPDIFFSLANSEYILNSDRAKSLFETALSSYKRKLASFPVDSKESKECTLDICRTLATKLAIGYLENEHNYKMTLKEFLLTVPNSPEGCEILLNLGDMFNSCQNPIVAAKIYEKLYSFNNQAEILDKMIDCCTRTEQNDKAINAILGQLKKDSQNATAVDMLVINADALNELNSAEMAVEKLSKSSVSYYKSLYKIKLAQNKFDEAIEVLNQGSLLGFQIELNLDYANAYYHNENFHEAIPYFEAALKHNKNNITQSDYAMCLMRCNEYKKAWSEYCEIIQSDSLPTFDCFNLAMQACLYSYSDDFVNIVKNKRLTYSNIQATYLKQVKPFEEKVKNIVSLNYAEKYKTLGIIYDTESVLSPMTNPNLMPNREPAELNFENLPIVFNNWLKKPYVKRIFTKTEIEQLRSDIQSAIANKDNPYYSFSGCLSSLHAYVEKYTEPVYYFYLIERIKALQQKSRRYESIKDELLAQLREKTDRKNELLAARKHVPKELKTEIEQLMNVVILFSNKVDRTTNKWTEMLEIKQKKYNLGLLIRLTSIISKEKMAALKNQESDETEEDEDKKIRVINPAFGKYLTLHKGSDDAGQDMMLFGTILQSNIESYRFLRNETVHAKGMEIKSDINEEVDEFGDPKRNWDALAETPIVKKEIFFDLLNIALFSPTSIFYYLSDLNFPETHSQIEKFFEENSNSARNYEFEK